MLAPLQMLPGMGGPSGQTAQQIATNFRDGFRCTFDVTAPGKNCGFGRAGKLILIYCIVNFTFNTLGLFLTKRASAVLNSISYALVLPLTAFAFSLPQLGNFREPTSAATVQGLLVTLLGFIIYEAGSHTYDPSRAPVPEPREVEPLLAQRASGNRGDGGRSGLTVDADLVVDTDGNAFVLPDSFQERIVGATHAGLGLKRVRSGSEARAGAALQI